MEYLDSHIILRTGLIEANIYPRFASDMSEFIAKTLFYTSDFYLDTIEKKKKISYYANNVLAQITEQVIFTEPYIIAKNNRHTTPYLDSDVEEIRKDRKLKLAISQLKHKFQNSTEALLHADLHTGSVMVTADRTAVIDPEFSYFGPIGFDIGALIGNLFLSYFSQDGLKTQDEKDKQRDKYKLWLLDQIVQIWNGFVKNWSALWVKDHKGDGYPPSFWKDDPIGFKEVQDYFYKNLLSDTLGFAGAKMLRRIVGVAHVADLESIKDTSVRAQCERRVLKVAKKLIVDRDSFDSIEAVTKFAQSVH
eukprot:TRINITY_DN754_c0_g1_i1.p1 TRINITY_DN754_c0_g1~~TRINITY_DN754_c0_g1_i1.p1  ORF type:complete len:306 (-),score=49.99 TRINITY_DN754_c0_g1_i1:79-996(-)